MPLSPEHALYRQNRNATFDIILGVIAEKMAAVPVTLALDVHAMSPSSARNGAEKECWQLLQNGIRHLKDGAPGGEPGSLASAMSKTSLRASSFATGLGVKPPKYEDVDYFAEFETGREEALFLTRRLIEAATADVAPSQKIIGAKMSLTDANEAFGSAAPIYDPELRAIFSAVQGAPKMVTPADVADMKKQTVLTFNALVHAFAETGEALKAALDTLPETPKPATAPSHKGQSFDFK